MTLHATTIPRATMRLQLNQHFTFADAKRVAPYLADIGISHLYASPILAARPGSMHGYDVIDPARLNPELGDESALRDLVAVLRSSGMGLIVDIVPNHMAVGHDNLWWQDVLRNGQESEYAAFFDIDWSSSDPERRGKVLAPFLGSSYGDALAAGDIRLDQTTPTPTVRYFDAIYPVRDATWTTEIARRSYDTSTTEGRQNLHRLLEQQHYRLAWWGVAGDEINWRRFFDINGLVGLRVEMSQVFDAVHAKVFELYRDGLIDGVRIDHIDGLADPPGYCRRLRAKLRELEDKRPQNAARGPAYIVVEKILGAGEAMPTDWDVDGTSGYDFMDTVNALQHDGAAEGALEDLWSSLSGRASSYEVEEAAARGEILSNTFHAQLRSLTAAIHTLGQMELTTRDISARAIRRALIALIMQFRIYRVYGSGAERTASESESLQTALTAACAASSRTLRPVLEQVGTWLNAPSPSSPEMAGLLKVIDTRFQQLTAPVAAKAVEDTAFYRYGRLLSRNDVGFSAAHIGLELDTFHAACLDRARTFPNSMLATATHDHKRGEDLRSRLAVLSEVPAEWEVAVRRWTQVNRRSLSGDDLPAISRGDEAMLYQMIVGAWPPDLEVDDRQGCDDLARRLAEWLEKAQREAKLETSWAMPDETYECASREFLLQLFQDGSSFLREAFSFADRIAPAGALNSLAQVVLKLTTPGVPDFFQGTEFWDFSLVDPDNRRPVDFDSRVVSLHEAAEPSALLPAWRDGRVKQATIARVLRFRYSDHRVFRDGGYEAVQAAGPLSKHLVAFSRYQDDVRYIVVVPRLTSGLLPGDGSLLIPTARWEGTYLEVPRSVPGAVFENILTSESFGITDNRLEAAAVLGQFPIAVLRSQCR